MNILVVGCGKVGSRLAGVLSRQGHDVSVIDRDAENFDFLSPDFNGFTTHGVPIDQDVLKKAGIESCDALAAVTPEDNVNLMVSQMAKEIFKVPKVLARIYDPKRGDVFSHFGLHTVCPTNLTVSAVCNALVENTHVKSMNIDAHTVSFTIMNMPKEFIGLTPAEIQYEQDEVLFAVERDGTDLILVNTHDIVFGKDDKLVFAKLAD